MYGPWVWVEKNHFIGERLFRDPGITRCIYVCNEEGPDGVSASNRVSVSRRHEYEVVDMNANNKNAFIVAFSILAVCVSCSGASADLLLLSDTFDRISGNPMFAGNGGMSDWGSNDNNLGGAAVQSYRVTPTDLVGDDQQYVAGGTGKLRHGTSLIDLDLTTDAPYGYILELDFKRGLNNSTGFIIGRDSTAGGLVMSLSDPDTDFGVKIRPYDAGNDLEFYEHGSLVGSLDGFWNNAGDSSAMHHAIISVTPNGYAPGGLADITVLIDGTSVFDGSFTWDPVQPITSGFGSMVASGTTGTVGFASSGDDAEFDDVRLTASLAGDLDGDGFVGISDLNLVLSCWNLKVSSDPEDPHRFADVSGDNFVGIDDLNTVLSNWNVGIGGPPENVVPEPGSLLVIGVSFLAFYRRNRRGEHTSISSKTLAE